MCYIPDPSELMERAMERQIDMIDENNTYPCCRCGRRFDVDEMIPVNGNPDSPLECGKEDCDNFNKEI